MKKGLLYWAKEIEFFHASYLKEFSQGARREITSYFILDNLLCNIMEDKLKS